MADNLFCIGQRKTGAQYDAGWYRTFRIPPKLGKACRSMVQEYLDNEEYSKVLIFFVEKCDLDVDYSTFLIGEMIDERY
jgi:hypothetical protein